MRPRCRRHGRSLTRPCRLHQRGSPRADPWSRPRPRTRRCCRPTPRHLEPRFLFARQSDGTSSRARCGALCSARRPAAGGADAASVHSFLDAMHWRMLDKISEREMSLLYAAWHNGGGDTTGSPRPTRSSASPPLDIPRPLSPSVRADSCGVQLVRGAWSCPPPRSPSVRDCFTPVRDGGRLIWTCASRYSSTRRTAQRSTARPTGSPCRRVRSLHNGCCCASASSSCSTRRGEWAPASHSAAPLCDTHCDLSARPLSCSARAPGTAH